MSKKGDKRRDRSDRREISANEATNRAELGNFRPLGAGTKYVLGNEEMPEQLNELPISESRSYSLTFQTAADLGFPIVGSVKGGYTRRVLVLERVAYKSITKTDEDDRTTEYQVGYAIRVCVTVSKWDADLKLTLPFVVAKASISEVEAQWLFQVIGLNGKVIDGAILPPQELDIETLVYAKQSLDKIIAAIHDPTTTFIPQVIAVKEPMEDVEAEYYRAAGLVIGLDKLRDGATGKDTKARFAGWPEPTQDAIGQVYINIVGNEIDPPDTLQQKTAEQYVRKLDARP